MSTTTIRLPDELKFRVAEAAKRAGTTSHNFILAAIAEKTERAELRAEFDAVADQRYARIIESGQAVAWEEMRDWLKDRAAGKAAPRPVARKLVP